MGRKNPVEESSGFKSAAALTTVYTGWTTNQIPTAGLDWVAIHLDYTYDSATSIEVKMQTSANGSSGWRDAEKVVEGVASLDELTRSPGADADLSYSWFVAPYKFVRFLAKRTGGSASDTLALEWSGV